jgi:uncharacterized membrane protein YuzA (DUF378 family)
MPETNPPDAPLAPLPPAPLATPPVPEPLNKTDMTALGLAIVGALNWGLVGLFNRNLVSGLFGKNTLLSRTVYATVGAAGAYAIFSAAKARRVAQAA